MSYVDLIIKYLSGDLSQQEASSFEKELESNAVLKEAFKEHAAAYELIRNQLQERDNKSFRAKLQKVMSIDASEKVHSKKNVRSWWYFPPAVACLVAIVLILLIPRPGNEKLLSRFYHPLEDAVVLAHIQDTRGASEQGIIEYRQGNYSEAMDLLSQRITQDQDNKLIMIYYLLSAMELERQQEALKLLKVTEAESWDLLDQCLSLVFRQLTRHVSIDEARGDRVNRNIT